MAIAPGTPGTGDYAGQVWGVATDLLGNPQNGWTPAHPFMKGPGPQGNGPGGGGSLRVPQGPTDGSGMDGSAPASSPAMTGLSSLLGGGGAGTVIGSGGDLPIASTAPTTPTPAVNASFGPDPGGSQMLTGPGASRRGIGQHVPPSLAGLLKVKTY